MKVISSNWQEMGRIFGNDKERFTRNIEYLNKHRIDAHAKDIDEDTYNQLLIATEWLQERVDQFMN